MMFEQKMVSKQQELKYILYENDGEKNFIIFCALRSCQTRRWLFIISDSDASL